MLGKILKRLFLTLALASVLAVLNPGSAEAAPCPYNPERWGNRTGNSGSLGGLVVETLWQDTAGTQYRFNTNVSLFSSDPAGFVYAPGGSPGSTSSQINFNTGSTMYQNGGNSGACEQEGILALGYGTTSGDSTGNWGNGWTLDCTNSSGGATTFRVDVGAGPSGVSGYWTNNTGQVTNVGSNFTVNNADRGWVTYIFVQSPPANQDPIGNVDIANCDSIQGWAFDPDNSSASIEVHVYIDGPAGGGGTGYNTGNTNVLRTDVNNAYGISGNHGFSWDIPGRYKDGASHSWYAYAINTPSGNNPVIGSGTFGPCANNAACGAYSGPSSVTAGASFSASVTMNNTGNTTWSRSRMFRLGSQTPQDNNDWGLTSNATNWTGGRIFMRGSDEAPPGQSYTFTATFVAPTSTGAKAFDWKMLIENVMWFGPICQYTITVSPAGTPCNIDNFKLSTPDTPATNNDITVDIGETITATWTIAGAASTRADMRAGGPSTFWPPPSAPGASGSRSGAETEARTYRYRLFCTGSDGVEISKTRDAIVQAVPCTIDIRANSVNGPISVNAGVNFTLSWTSTGAATVGGNMQSGSSGFWPPGSMGTSGSVSGSELTGGQRVYRVSCTSTAGNDSDTVTVNVADTPADLTVTKAALDPTTNSPVTTSYTGAQVKYEVTIINSGSLPANSTVIRDFLPLNAKYADPTQEIAGTVCDGVAHPRGTCVNANPSSASLRWDIIAVSGFETLKVAYRVNNKLGPDNAAQASDKTNYVAKVCNNYQQAYAPPNCSAPPTSGDYVLYNFVEVTWSGQATPRKDDHTLPLSPSLEVDKTGDSQASPGGQIVYRLALNNANNSPNTGTAVPTDSVVVTDRFNNTQLSFASDDDGNAATPGCSAAGSTTTCTWTYSPSYLMPSSLSLTFDILGGAPAGTTITNNGCIDSPVTNEVCDPATTDVTVKVYPWLQTAGGGVHAGEDITVSNNNTVGQCPPATATCENATFVVSAGGSITNFRTTFDGGKAILANSASCNKISSFGSSTEGCYGSVRLPTIDYKNLSKATNNPFIHTIGTQKPAACTDANGNIAPIRNYRNIVTSGSTSGNNITVDDLEKKLDHGTGFSNGTLDCTIFVWNNPSTLTLNRSGMKLRKGKATILLLNGPSASNQPAILIEDDIILDKRDVTNSYDLASLGIINLTNRKTFFKLSASSFSPTAANPFFANVFSACQRKDTDLAEYCNKINDENYIEVENTRASSTSAGKQFLLKGSMIARKFKFANLFCQDSSNNDCAKSNPPNPTSPTKPAEQLQFDATVLINPPPGMQNLLENSALVPSGRQERGGRIRN